MINYTEIYKKYLTQMVKYKYINDCLKLVEDDLSYFKVNITNKK